MPVRVGEVNGCVGGWADEWVWPCTDVLANERVPVYRALRVDVRVCVSACVCWQVCRCVWAGGPVRVTACVGAGTAACAWVGVLL